MHCVAARYIHRIGLIGYIFDNYFVIKAWKLILTSTAPSRIQNQ